MKTLREHLADGVEQQIRDAAQVTTQVGTVSYRDTTGNGISVVFDNTELATPCKIFAGVDAFAGDRVGVQRFGTDWVVVGCYTRRGPSEDGWFGYAAAGTRGAAGYANMPGGIAFQFIKRYDGTRITARLMMTCFNSTALSEASVAVQINGTDYELAHYFFSNIGERETLAGERELSGIPAGTYTVTGRWARVSGTGTIDMSTLDLVTIRMVESAPPFTA